MMFKKSAIWNRIRRAFSLLRYWNNRNAGLFCNRYVILCSFRFLKLKKKPTATLVDSMISIPQNRFYGLWSSQGPSATVGVYVFGLHLVFYVYVCITISFYEVFSLWTWFKVIFRAPVLSAEILNVRLEHALWPAFQKKFSPLKIHKFRKKNYGF